MERLEGQVSSHTDNAYLSMRVDHTACFQATFGCFFETAKTPIAKGFQELIVNVCGRSCDFFCKARVVVYGCGSGV
jgi:hypothetical protein